MMIRAGKADILTISPHLQSSLELEHFLAETQKESDVTRK